MALGLGVEDRCPSTSWTPLLLAVGFTSSGCWSFSSRLSSSESIVFSKNWRHSFSSRLRKRSPSSSCQDQESELTKWLCDVFLCATFSDKGLFLAATIHIDVDHWDVEGFVFTCVQSLHLSVIVFLRIIIQYHLQVFQCSSNHQ